MSHQMRNGKRVKVFTRFTNGKFDGYYSVPARMAGAAVPYNVQRHKLLGKTLNEARK